MSNFIAHTAFRIPEKAEKITLDLGMCTHIELQKNFFVNFYDKTMITYFLDNVQYFLLCKTEHIVNYSGEVFWYIASRRK